MRKLVFLSFFAFFLSCDKFVERPDNLVDKQKMAQVLAEMVLNDQVVLVNPSSGNAEAGTRFILKKYGVSAKDFSDSYEYYTITEEMKDILDDSQQILMDKYPGSKNYIEKKIKENPDVPGFER